MAAREGPVAFTPRQVRENVCVAIFSCLHPPLQDMTLIFLTARFDENRGVWLYTVSELTRTYTRKWFWIDLVRASAVAAEMCQPQSVFRAGSFSVAGPACVSSCRACCLCTVPRAGVPLQLIVVVCRQQARPALDGGAVVTVDDARRTWGWHVVGFCVALFYFVFSHVLWCLPQATCHAHLDVRMSLHAASIR